MPAKSKRPPNILKKIFILSPISINCLIYGFNKHPDKQQSSYTVKGIPEYCIFTPRFFLLAEHAHHYRDNSSYLKDTEEHSTNPPSHILHLFVD
jgi:hypothetical protein